MTSIDSKTWHELNPYYYMTKLVPTVQVLPTLKISLLCRMVNHPNPLNSTTIKPGKIEIFLTAHGRWSISGYVLRRIEGRIKVLMDQ